MCGLFASIGLPPDAARIDMVAHRGPDGRGWEVHASPAGPVALGHRRLTIIDLSDGGRQPMADPTARYRLIYNGEIYNYIELRDELIALGETFCTESDSEVLLRAYVVWGESCLPKLRGMFAFILWDNAEKRLFAARDRYGIKPLYFATSATTVAFGSEIKQLLGLPGVTGRINRNRVRDFLEVAISDHTAETMFEGAMQIRGGELTMVDASGKQPRVEIRRWHRIQTERTVISETEVAERFRYLLDDSVRLHLRSDVRIGSCLSGGLDSSSIVMLMARQLANVERVRTISACYREADVDERRYADAVSSAAGARSSHVYPVASDVVDHAAKITWHQDEPFGSASIVAQWCVFAEAARQGIKVMLDGQGADELLAGYHFAFPAHLAHLARGGRLVEIASIVHARRRLHGAPTWMQLARMASAMAPPGAAQWVRRLRRDAREHGWLRRQEGEGRAGGSGAMATAADLVGLPLPRDVASFSDLMTHATNLPMLLHWEDRNAMAHGIEARVPFLDPPLADFCLALGNDHKIVGAETKRVMRLAMRAMLPSMVVERTDKLGFATPESQWMRGPLKEFIVHGVDAASARFPSLFDRRGLERLRDDVLAGATSRVPPLWRVANLGIWGDVFAVSE